MERISTRFTLPRTEPKSSGIFGYCKKLIPSPVDRQPCHLLFAVTIGRDARNEKVVVRIVVNVPYRNATFPEVGLVEEVACFVEDRVLGIEVFDVDVVGVWDGSSVRE